jgi:hypothetical protein
MIISQITNLIFLMFLGYLGYAFIRDFVEHKSQKKIFIFIAIFWLMLLIGNFVVPFINFNL